MKKQRNINEVKHDHFSNKNPTNYRNGYGTGTFTGTVTGTYHTDTEYYKVLESYLRLPVTCTINVFSHRVGKNRYFNQPSRVFGYYWYLGFN